MKRCSPRGARCGSASVGIVIENQFGFAASLLPIAVAGDETGVESRLSELLGSDDAAGFEKAIEPRDFVFPDDHGPHPGFQPRWCRRALRRWRR